MSDPFEPDWSKAPTWANYATRDANGRCVWWELRPSANTLAPHRIDWWVISPEHNHQSRHQKFDQPDNDWRNSLRARPEAK